MANSADTDQLAEAKLIWIYTVCKGRIYPSSAGPGLKPYMDLRPSKIWAFSVHTYIKVPFYMRSRA